NNMPPSTTVQANAFESVGNPYASSIDLRKITKSKEVDEFVFVWDPKLSGAYGLGAFQTLSYDPANNNYYPTPGGGSYGSPSSPVNYLQSGQAFFVQTTGPAGTVSFTEAAKASISNAGTMYLRNGELATSPVNSAQLRSTLYGVNTNGSTFVTDGNLIQYKAGYSNKIDGMDARKNVNSSENFGIISGGKTLAIERRQSINKNDTIFYNLTGVVAQRYRMELLATGLSAYAVEGYVEDNYLKTRKPLNMEGTTTVDFSVTNDKGSYAPDRFRIVFKQAAPKVVPVTFVSVTGVQKNTDVQLDWKVQNEKAILQYEVEKSTDGVKFTKSATVAAANKGVGNYEWMDKGVNAGLYYYRIKTIGKDGGINYTAIVKVVVVFAPPSISIYPNPITDGIIHLQLVNQPAGRYGIRLMNPLGQTIVKKQVEHAGGNGTENVKWDYNLAHGVYQLEVLKPNGGVEVIKVMY
ncbi:MAG: T9SS type A sorting domain-containing protein, partial [Ginsengibacter sp.]